MGLARLAGASQHRLHSVLLGIVLWLILLALNMLTSIMLLGNAHTWIERVSPGTTLVDVADVAKAAGGAGQDGAAAAVPRKASKIKLGPVAKIEMHVMRNTNRNDWD